MRRKRTIRSDLSWPVLALSHGRRRGGASLHAYGGETVTVIAPGPEALICRKASGDGSGLGKRNSMSKENVLSQMKPMILAEHHPAIMAIFPDINTRQDIILMGGMTRGEILSN